MNSLQESGVTSLLKRAVELDNDGRFAESLANYESALEILLKIMKESTNDEIKKHLRKKFTEYMDRAEILKKLIKRDENYQSEIIQIENDSLHHSYSNVFGKYLDHSVTNVEVDDPYIRSNHQILNFLRFCELLEKTTKVNRITLTTGVDNENAVKSFQRSSLEELQSNLHSHSVDLMVIYSQTIHDREIRLNNGWTIKIGRGLDYFKSSSGKFSIGFCDMDFRKCHETTVNIFHKKSTKIT